jgi:DnaK suppressor protein
MNTKITSIDSGNRRRKASLESKLKDLLQLTGDRESLEIQPMADPIDQVRSSTDRDMAVEALNQQAHSIQEIRSALERIEEGSYGTCERCEELIPAKRLEALPWARMCVSCQSAVEGEAQQGRTIYTAA